jgi:hypothetical protein
VRKFLIVRYFLTVFSQDSLRVSVQAIANSVQSTCEAVIETKWAHVRAWAKKFDWGYLEEAHAGLGADAQALADNASNTTSPHHTEVGSQSHLREREGGAEEGEGETLGEGGTLNLNTSTSPASSVQVKSRRRVRPKNVNRKLTFSNCVTMILTFNC